MSVPATVPAPALPVAPETIEALDLPPAPPRPRPRTLLVATSFAVGASAMLLAGLLAVYLHLRSAAGGTTASWVPQGVDLPEVIVNVSGVTLLMSVVTMQWAVYAIARNDRRNAFLAMGLTLILGLAFVNGMGFAWNWLELPVGEGAFSIGLYSVTGAQVAMVLVACLYVVVVGFRALAGEDSPRDVESVSAAALYWHFSVAAFAVVWALVWALK